MFGFHNDHRIFSKEKTPCGLNSSEPVISKDQVLLDSGCGFYDIKIQPRASSQQLVNWDSSCQLSHSDSSARSLNFITSDEALLDSVSAQRMFVIRHVDSWINK
jgi:hypothetical protein